MSGKLIGGLFVLMLASTIFFSKSVYAAAALKIAISPAIISKTINPGQSVSDRLDVTNQGADAFSYSVYASPYGVQNENYQPVFKVLPGFANVSSWFTFSSSSGYLTPGNDSPIRYSINVPAGTSPGGYYAAVFANTSSNASTSNKTQIQIRQRVGSLFYLTVSGKAYENGSVSAWQVPFLQSSPVTASLKLQNSGRLYYISKVNVYFEDILGHVKYQYTTQKIVLPKVVRAIPLSWPNPPFIGLYKVVGSATIYGQKQLSTKYVLIVSTRARWVIVLVAAGVVLFFGLQNITVTLMKNKSKKAKIKK